MKLNCIVAKSVSITIINEELCISMTSLLIRENLLPVGERDVRIMKVCLFYV